MGAAFAFCFKQFDLRWSRLVTAESAGPTANFHPDARAINPGPDSRARAGSPPKAVGAQALVGVGAARGAARRSPR